MSRFSTKGDIFSEVWEGTLWNSIRLGDTVKYHKTGIFSIKIKIKNRCIFNLGYKEETNG